MTVQDYFLSLSSNLHVTSPYGWRIHPITGEEHFHAAIDIAGEAEGFPTPCPRRAIVSNCGYSVTYGNFVLLGLLAEKYEIFIAHLKDIKVAMDEIVNPGKNIGGMGKTGAVTGTHWHIEVRHGGEKHDPAHWPLDGFKPPPPRPKYNYTLFSRRPVIRRQQYKGRR
jgi:murein DD-endopeptidase MepM/ murein hydrolase activator NlpD